MAKKAAKKAAKKSTTKPKAPKSAASKRTPKVAETEAENTIDKKALTDAVGRIEELDDQILSEKGKFMERCLRIKQQKDVIFDEAKNKGIPKKELKGVIKARSLERQADAIFADLEPDEQDTFSAMRSALGDWDDETPMGRYANQQSGGAAPKTQADKDDQVSLLAKLGRGEGAEPAGKPKLDS